MDDEFNQYSIETPTKSRKWLWILFGSIFILIIILLIYFLFLKTPKEIEECFEFSEHRTQRSLCIQEKAQINKNSDYCELLRVLPDYYNGEEYSKYNCIQSIEKDASICEKEKSPLGKDLCLKSAARYLVDEKICQEISSGSREKEHCLRYVGTIKNDPSICIDNTFCMIEIALNKSNKKICNLLTSDVGKEQCLAEFSIIKKDVEECYKLEDNFQASKCFSRLAITLNNESLCLENHYNWSKDSCLSSLAYTQGNIDLCNKIKYDPETYVETKDGCFFGIASNKSDATICENILSNDVMNHCKARTLLDNSFCSSIQDNKVRESCTVFIAFETKDETLCKSLPYENDCIDAIQNWQ